MLASSPKPSPNDLGCASYEKERWYPIFNENIPHCT